MHDNELPNAACDQHVVTAAGPYTVYGLELPAGQYRLVAAGHPAHLPDTTTITYLPTSGAAEGEGPVTVGVTRSYRKPSYVNVPPGSPSDSWVAASYLPRPGIANVTPGHSNAQWIGPGGLYTIDIDSAHSSLTLEQAAALLVPVDLDELQASLTPTATVTPQPPATGNGPVHEGGSDNEAVPVFVAGIGALLLAAAAILIIQKRRAKDRE